MEDLMYYIALGLIITFSLIRKIGKAAAKKSKGGNVHQTAPTPQTTGASLSEIFKEMERVTKAQAEQAKAQMQTPTTLAQSTTTMEPMPVTYHHPQKAQSPVTYHHPQEAQSLENIIDEEELYLREQAKRAQAAQKAKKSANNSTKPHKAQTTAKPSKERNKGNAEVNSTSSEEFDLREAIIYAEILNPKFEE